LYDIGDLGSSKGSPFTKCATQNLQTSAGQGASYIVQCVGTCQFVSFGEVLALGAIEIEQPAAHSYSLVDRKRVSLHD
jgi:hypothetical protein